MYIHACVCVKNSPCSGRFFFLLMQEQLQRFREEAGNALKSNYTILLKERKLPLSLLTESQKTKRVHLLATEPFDETFGARSRRKRPRLAASELSSLVSSASRKSEEFEERGGTQADVSCGQRAHTHTFYIYTYLLKDHIAWNWVAHTG